ncbi:outer membrane protein assembly factor BamE [Paraneptunicella aestuarii]|uniref:outer membrane protein assembly factor BamE n=1 Tax=Paraneptunicella aestuarii TaxID=2831148 RepID=UPI001E5A0F88|nr:outer membrane protein assembly factor BamE [Paraneptunicella aestuarii]UAA39881.1 outer membrane protein assembly factor BamE [Paraneptunicella aestuarii]
MSNIKAFLFTLSVIAGTTSLSACSSWVFRIDIPQGNYLEAKDVEKLRIGMTKEQVVFVLGNPVLKDSFEKDIYYYIYEMKRGMKSRGEDFRKDLVIEFENDKVAKVTGDFELSEDFNTPLE